MPKFNSVDDFNNSFRNIKTIQENIDKIYDDAKNVNPEENNKSKKDVELSEEDKKKVDDEKAKLEVEVNKLKEGMSFAYLTEAEKKRKNDAFEAVNPGNKYGEAFKNAGVNHARNRQHFTFLSYLMAKKNMSFLDAINYAPGADGFEEALNEFHDFLVKHPIVNRPAKETEENVGEWTDIFMKAADKFGEYKFPDIDYSNPEEVKKHSYEFDSLLSFEINYSQEFGKMLKGGNKVYAEKKAGGSNALNQKMAKVEGIQSVLTDLKMAYQPDNFGDVSIHLDPDGFFKGHAKNRIKFTLRTAPTMRGKSIDQVRKEAGVKNLYSIIMAAIDPIKINTADSKNYFINGLTEEQKTNYKDALDKTDEEMRKIYNSSFQRGPANSFNDKIISASKDVQNLEWVFEAENDPAELVNRVNSDDGKQLREAFKESFGDILNSGNTAELHSLLNINTPVNRIKIGGKTPEELWGENAAVLTDTSDKETFYMTIIMEECKFGDKDITVDSYMIDKDFKLVKNEVTAFRSPAGNARELAFFKGIHELRGRLKDFQDQLLETGNAGSPTYNNMLSSLETCIKSLDPTDKENHASVEDILKNMKNLEKAGKDYYKNHTGIYGLVKGYKADGKLRIDISEKFMNNMSYEMERFKDISKGLNLYIDNNDFDRSTLAVTHRVHEKWKRFKAVYNYRAENAGKTILTDNSLDMAYEPTDKILRDADKRVELRKQLKAIARTSSQAQRLEEGFGNVFTSPVDLAKRYVYKEYSKMIRLAGTSNKYPSVDEVENVFARDDFAKNYNDEVDELIQNEDFRKLAADNPKKCIDIWTKRVNDQDLERHNHMAEVNQTYKRLMKENPKDFRIRWNTAEYRIKSWAKDWAKLDVKKSADFMKEDISILPSISIEDDIRNMEFEEGKNAIIENDKAIKALCNKYSALLTQAIIKDNYERYGQDKIMDIAINPDSLKKMQKFISDGLEKDGAFTNKAIARKTLTDITGMKSKAIDYIKEGESAEKARQDLKNREANKNMEGPKMGR